MPELLDEGEMPELMTDSEDDEDSADGDDSKNDDDSEDVDDSANDVDVDEGEPSGCKHNG